MKFLALTILPFFFIVTGLLAQTTGDKIFVIAQIIGNELLF